MEYAIDSEPPPEYTAVHTDSSRPNPRDSTTSSTSGQLEGLDDHIRGLNIASPVSRTSNSLTTNISASDSNSVGPQGASTVPGRVSGTPRYLYYQIFSPDGAIESKCSFREDDPYTGRVIASRIAPPRTVEYIKRFLCKQENISDAEHADLFASALTSKSELNDQDHLPILARDGPGSVADDPIALIIKPLPPTASSKDYRPPISDHNQPLMPLGPFSRGATPFQGDKSMIKSVAFSPDGTQIVSGSGDGEICVWNVTSGQLAIAPIATATGVFSVAFSPDGRRIASGCFQRPYIRIWEACTGIPVRLPFQGQSNSVFSVAFSPDGRYIASGSADKTVRIWDAQLGKHSVCPLKGHTGSVWSVAFSPDGCRVVSGSDDTTVRVWNTKTGELVAGPFWGHSKRICSVAFSPRGRWVVSGSDDRGVTVWDTKELEAGIGSAVVTPPSRCFKGHSGMVKSVVSSHDGEWIVSGSEDGTVHIWSFDTGQVEVILRASEGRLTDEHRFCSAAISPKGDRIVAGAKSSGLIYMWSRV